MSSLHVEFYRQQLLVREFLSHSNKRKVLVEDVRGFLGDHYVYVEHFVRYIRNNSEAFNIIAECCDTNLPFLDMLVESFAYSFFEDLMNPESTELELLRVLKMLMQIEFKRHPHSSDIFNENVSSVLGKILTIYTKRRPQREYLGLVLKRPLTKILHSEEADLRLDPKTIYQNLNLRRETAVKMDSPVRLLLNRSNSSSSRGWFCMQPVENLQLTVERERQYIDMHESDYYMEDYDVKEQIDIVSVRLIEHCRLILASLYSNVSSMPYGVRWICKCICELTAARKANEDSETEQRLMLGTFLFTKWWLVAINSADSNGLISDTLISSERRGNLSLISNVNPRQILKHVFREKTFEGPQYSHINQFILEEIPHMRQFFVQVIDIEDFVNGKRPTHKRPPLQPITTQEISQQDQSDGVMAFYYKQQLKCKHLPSVDLGPEETLDLASFEQFRFQGIALTVNEVRVLVDLVISNEAQFLHKGLGSLTKSAKKIKAAIADDNLFKSEGPQLDNFYLLFAEVVLPDFEKTSRRTVVVKMSDNYHQSLLISKVKGAVCDLLFGLDSFAMFFERTKNCSLPEIIDFVLKFSYLFENRKGQERVPLRLLAQFLDTHLKQLPDTFSDNNFAKLYKAILMDYEKRFALKRRVAGLNKQLLLLAVNMLEQHLVDSRQEAKLQQSNTHLQKFLNLLKKLEVPVCIALHQLKNKTTVVILPQRSCLHVRSHSALIPKRLKRNFPKSASQEVNLGRTPGHVCTIEEFAEQFSDLDQVARCTKSPDDTELVGKSFRGYLAFVEQEVLKASASSEVEIEDTQAVVEEIESYVMRRMFSFIYPSVPSHQDDLFHNRTLELEWVTPEHLDILSVNQNELMWKFAIEALNSADDRITPDEKVNCYADFVTTIVNIIYLCSSNAAASADDALPIIIYLIIKARPRRMHSNINYVAKFLNQSKLMTNSGFCFSQIRSAVTFIETLEHSCLSVTEENFLLNCSEARAKHGISNLVHIIN